MRVKFTDDGLNPHGIRWMMLEWTEEQLRSRSF
jgi:hypothetical protein